MRIAAGEARHAMLAASIEDSAPVLDFIHHLAAPVADLLAQVDVDDRALELAA